MADVKISALPASAGLDATDVLPVVNAGVTEKATTAQVVVGGGGVLATRLLTAGAGLTGGGDLSADRTFDVVANADGSLVVNANDVQVGILATDAQHGTRGGGTQHAVATGTVAGFMSAADKAKSDTVSAFAAPHTWQATGDLVGFTAQAASYDGLAQNAAVLLAGLGIFDGPRISLVSRTITSLIAIVRAPSSTPDPITVECYRIRGAYPGTVTSLGTVTVAAGQVFEVGIGVPGVTDILPSDLLFVAFSALPADAQAADISVMIV